MRFLSLFSGIETASVAWTPLGWECAAVAEIDKFPNAVLAHHYPNVPNLGNVCGVTRERLIEVGPVDAIVFGFPCQDLSVAGKRTGLKGARSGLFFEAMRIVELCRELWSTRWTIVENVPGLLSSAGGADFAAVVGELVGTEFSVPKAKWQNTGVALGPRGLVEWSILDAQWFGVPQRRRRVFLVRDSGDWRSRPPVLFERQSLSGDTPPRREKRESTPTIPSRRTGGGGLGTDFDCDGGLVASRISSVVRERGVPSTDLSPGQNGRPDDRQLRGHGSFFDWPTGTFVNTGQGYWNEATKAQALGTQARALYESTVVTHSLRADGFDASEDGTGRGTPLVPLGFMPARTFGKDGGIDSRYAPRDVCDALHTASGGGNKAPLIAFTCKDSGADCGETSPTLRSMNFDQSHANGGGQVAVAFTERGRKDGRSIESQPDISYCLTNPGEGSRTQDRNVVTPSMQVRRLTPTECCRLQGFPDNYLDIPCNGKPAADGPKYKTLGNSFAVPVVRWIGRRIQLIDLLS